MILLHPDNTNRKDTRTSIAFQMGSYPWTLVMKKNRSADKDDAC